MSHTDEQMEPQGLVAPKVTPAQIAELMKRVTVHHTHGEEPTAYVRADAWLDGSFHLAAAMSKAVNPANFDRQLGVEYSTKDALAAAEEKLWELEGYNLYRNLMKNCEGSKHCSGNISFAIAPEFPWESIPTHQVLKYVGPVSFEYVWAVTSDQQDYWTCTISLHAAPEPVPEITANGITEEVAFAAAIRTLKEIVYKNEWVLG
ncbi:hypothetical protein L1A45_01180 [Acinetobacter variabilis]|uniref:Gp49 family protein n=1 Tax=Acinetobacter variabilis TaxID=70346 RepID=UPI00377016AC